MQDRNLDTEYKLGEIFVGQDHGHCDELIQEGHDLVATAFNPSQELNDSVVSDYLERHAGCFGSARLAALRREAHERLEELPEERIAEVLQMMLAQSQLFLKRTIEQERQGAAAFPGQTSRIR